MQRYFIANDQINDKCITIDKQDFHHIKNVMRMKVGDYVYVCDTNNTYKACIQTFLDKEVKLQIVEKIDENVELDIEVCIAQGLVRREKNEEVLRRIVELGASEYINVEMERSIVKATKDKSERLQAIIKEASEQCHRSKLMKYSGVKSFKQFLDYTKQFDLLLFCYEESGRCNDMSLSKLLHTFNKKNILVLIGPEGGISDNEVKLLSNTGFHAVGLGPRILRTETAPLYIMSVIAYEREINR